MSDGDALFVLGTGRAGRSPGMLVLAAMAAEATARAVVRAVQAAESLRVGTLHLPALRDL
jgi:L-aminopeptidase/D-esterase-like protein